MLTIPRRFTKNGEHPKVTYTEVQLTKPDGSPGPKVIAPAHWSANAIKVSAERYLRRAGVPAQTRRDTAHFIDGARPFPDFILPSVPVANTTFGGETDFRQMFHRLAGCWTYWGWRLGYFLTTIDAENFYAEVYHMLEMQMWSPNSPQWFNTGLNWAYGITGPDAGQWAIEHVADNDRDQPGPALGSAPVTDARGYGVAPVPVAQLRPAASACFILSVKDDLLNKGGIYDGLTREARVFKFGGGAGGNFSAIRGEGEGLSAGGRASGLMSFLDIFDAGGGTIKSGGTTRRAAKMVVVDMDHPEIEDFIDWKAHEEYRAAALVAGDMLIRKYREELAGTKEGDSTPLDDLIPEYVRRRLADAARAGTRIEWPDEPYSPKFDDPHSAYKGCGGQNSNNSVRVTEEFMRAVREGDEWHLRARRDGSVVKTVRAAELWNKVIRAAWTCADPGVQFDTTINDWHTCPADGPQSATNPCAEYSFLDDTACNLGSAKLTAFAVAGPHGGTVGFDAHAFVHACSLATIVLDITVGMAAYPSEEVADGSRKYRTIGLGYCDLGALLMQLGIGYGTEEALAWTAALTGLMHFAAMNQSALLVNAVGAFPRYEANAVHVQRVMANHAAFVRRLTRPEDDCPQQYTGLSVEPWQVNGRLVKDRSVMETLDALAGEAMVNVRAFGLRNAQLTVLAPTGTIGLQLDCDTTGIEPAYSLKTFKTLVGGGSLSATNRSVESGCLSLGYAPVAARAVAEYVEATGKVDGAPHLRAEHYHVFSTANPPEGSVAVVSTQSHILMMAAAQPVLSGAISKTVNLPQSATPDDVRDAYELAHDSMVKAVALYIDYCKMSQPLQTGVAAERTEIGAAPPNPFHGEPEMVVHPDYPAGNPEPHEAVAENWDGRVIPINDPEYGEEQSDSGGDSVRHKLPSRRAGYTQKFRVGGQGFYMRTGEYKDGKLGEIFIDLSGEGSAFRAFGNALAVAVSLGLQHGVPLEEFVDAFVGSRFEPAGAVAGHDRIKMASSVLDAMFRDLAIHYLKRDELAHVQLPPEPEGGNGGAAPIPEEWRKGLSAGALHRARREAAVEPQIVEAAPPAPRFSGQACPECGNFSLTKAKCPTCTICGWNAGCG